MSDVGTVLSTIISGMLLGGMLALTALGLSIVLGVMRLVNLAHGDFLVVGAYAGLFFLKFTGVDPLLGLPVIALFVAALVVPLYGLLLAPLGERGAEAQMMTMFAVSIILENVFVLAFSADTRSIERDYATLPLTLGSVTVPLIYVIGFAIAVSLILAVHWLISKTRFGRELRRRPGRRNARRRRQTRADGHLRARRGLRGRRRHAHRRRVPVWPFERRRLSPQQPRHRRARGPWQRAGYARWRIDARLPAKPRWPDARRRLP